MGRLIDFNVKLLKDGIRGLVNELKDYYLCALGVLRGKFNTSSFLRNRPLSVKLPQGGGEQKALPRSPRCRRAARRTLKMAARPPGQAAGRPARSTIT